MSGPPPPYGPPPAMPPGPGGWGTPPPTPPKRSRGPWLAGGAAVVVVLIVVGVVLFVTIGRDNNPPVAEPVATTTTTPAVTATTAPPLPSSLTTRKRTTTTPSTTRRPPTSVPISSTATAPASPEQAQQITALARALVDGISKGDTIALATITCEPLASEIAALPAGVPDPAVYDRVENIAVSPDGSSATVDVFAYTVEDGPPAESVTFAVQKQGTDWKACEVKD